MKRAITYSRATRSWQYAGPQRPAMEDFWLSHTAGGLGAEIVAAFDDYVDHTELPYRPGLDAAVEYCEQHQVDFLIVYWLLSITRPGFDLQAFEYRLARAGTQLITCHEC